MYRWMFPAAVVLPLWILLGWVIFDRGWSFLWVLFIAMPSVFVGELVLSLLVRSRPSARAERAASWWDVLGFGVWHALIIVVGCFPPAGTGWYVAGAIVAALALFWLQLWQLWREARGNGLRVRENVSWSSDGPGTSKATTPADPDVFVIREGGDNT